MKHMKLGSKPDLFQADGKFIRYVVCDLATDITISIGDVKFYLHKFPLLSKSNRLARLMSQDNEDSCGEINIADFPGGPKAFEICAKFCYGMIVILNPYNVAAVRCGAEYLEMTEDLERGNLVSKIEIFLNTGILRSWKDSIIVLQTAQSLLPWSEDLKIICRCIDSIASKTCVDPSSITWSYTHNRKLSAPDRIVEVKEKVDTIPLDWWIEDICELDINLFKQVMVAVKSKGRMDRSVIGEALREYIVRWLPDSVESCEKNKFLLETIISLFPSDKGVGSCSFLLKLLKVAVLVGVDDLSKEDLMQRVSRKLHEAKVNDLLIESQSIHNTLYDVDLVKCIVGEYLKHEQHCTGFDLGHGSLLAVGKLFDGYLVEIASDPNLVVTSFIDLSQLIPDSARPIHDMLYKAVDVYLKEHPSLTKSEKKKLCGLMDVRKLTAAASMHAAQNERLPLRVVVQVLFFEQVKANSVIQPLANNSLECDKNTPEQNPKISLKDEKLPKNTKSTSKNSRSGAQLLPSRSRRIFDKLWIMGKGNSESRSSETSGSSQSPSSLAPGDIKSSGSSSRNRRHSIS